MKKEGYPTNYEFTGDKGKVYWDSPAGVQGGMVCGYQEEILNHQGYPVPPEGFLLIRLPNGSIISIHESRLK